ncbi:MAG: metallophosphoesterase [Acetobacteraceae bacterium]|nr:metallophosphoesterase [Acetobacteraceae bacterium]
MCAVGMVAFGLALLAVAGGHAADLPDAWAEMSPAGGTDLRALVPSGADCPKLTIAADETSFTIRAEPDPDFPFRVCSARLPASAHEIAVDGLSTPALPRDINRIVVLGDTGCRIKGRFVQDCNSPAAWPFAAVARAAAQRHPDLVIHVGDYYYRETACPEGNQGCARSPYGDHWAAWKADFFDPAAPLLAAAPWVMVRGNHESCARGGRGWLRLLDPHPEVTECPVAGEPYALRLPGLQLLVFDSADADDDKADPDRVGMYRGQLQALLSQAEDPAWLLTHRPVWALAEGWDVSPGSTLNLTEQAAIRDLVPEAVHMVLSGHVHDFTAYSFGPERPAQLIVGTGGDTSDPIPQPIKPDVVIDGMQARQARGLRDYGYLVLERAGTEWNGTFYSTADAVLARCTLRSRDLTCDLTGGRM